LAGKYRIDRLIGQGAMGAVFAARHEILQKNVAIKMMTDEHAGSPEAVTRFINEARAVASIEGDHVARVLDVGQLENGRPFMAIELLEGADLEQILQQRGPLPSHEAVDLVLQALEALAEAHSLGIVHRDLKPANLFLARRRDGTSLVKVLDFGVSKRQTVPSPTPSITATTAILGSPVYMAPEQLQSAKNVDARADIWALGVVLYELLTGRPPFQGDNVAQLFVAILENPPTPVRSIRPSVPPGLEEVILRCLSRDVSHRFQNVAELAAALEPFAEGSKHPSVQHIQHIWETAPQWIRLKMTSFHLAPRRRPRLVAVAIAAMVLGTGIVGTMHLIASKPVASHTPTAPLQRTAPRSP
jgi:serine/threonine-protein kinase